MFVYHCFDRIVIHGYLSALSRPEQVVLALDLHFFGEALVGEHNPPHQPIAAFAGAENVFELALFEPGDGLGRDHAAVGHDAHPPNAEALAQPVDHRQQHGDAGRVAGPHLRANR